MTPPILVWDASALHHAALADRVDVLAHLAEPWRNVTTAAVLEELEKSSSGTSSSRRRGWTSTGSTGSMLCRCSAGGFRGLARGSTTAGR